MNPSEHLQVLQAQAEEAAARGETAGAIEQALVVARLAERQRDHTASAVALNFIARQHFFMGQFSEALEHGRRAVEGWRQAGRPDKECDTLAMLALTLSEIGAHDLGLRLAQQALSQARSNGEDASIARALATCGVLQARVGDMEQGEVALLHALSLARDLSDQASVLGITNSLLALQTQAHETHVSQGRAHEAQLSQGRLLSTARRALALRAELKNLFERVMVQSNAAAALLSCGHAQEALELLRTTVEQAQQGDLSVAGLRAQTRLGKALLRQGDLADAAVLIGELQEQLDRNEHAGARLDLMQLQAELARARGETARADEITAELQRVQGAQQARLEQIRARHRDYPDSLGPMPAP